MRRIEIANKIEETLLALELDKAGIRYIVRTFNDAAYGGIFVPGEGYGYLEVNDADAAQAEEIRASLGEAVADDPTTGDSETDDSEADVLKENFLQPKFSEDNSPLPPNRGSKVARVRRVLVFALLIAILVIIILLIGQGGRFNLLSIQGNDGQAVSALSGFAEPHLQASETFAA